MDRLRPALVALGVWIAGNLVLAFVFTIWVGAGPLESMPGRILWVAIPQFLVGFAITVAAAYAHRRPERRDRRRHALAVLIPAAVLIVAQALLNMVGESESLATSTAFVSESVGAVAGWLLVGNVMRRRERTDATGDGYF